MTRYPTRRPGKLLRGLLAVASIRLEILIPVGSAEFAAIASVEISGSA